MVKEGFSIRCHMGRSMNDESEWVLQMAGKSCFRQGKRPVKRHRWAWYVEAGLAPMRHSAKV